MTFINRASTALDIDIISQELGQGLHGTFDLALLFVSGHSPETILEITRAVRKAIAVDHLVGCSGFGVISQNKEIENTPSVSLLVARLPDVIVTPFYFDHDRYDGLQSDEDWYDLFDVYPNEKPKFILFADAMNTTINHLIEGVNQAYPNCPITGALNGIDETEQLNAMIFGDRVYDSGVVGVHLTGKIHMEAVVSQGCRPIGDSFIVTDAEGNMVYELAGKPFYEVLESVLTAADDEERELAQDAIFVGIAVDEYKHRMRQGDFFIRLLMGIDEDSGAGVLTDTVQPGQTVKFHIRDAEAADKDLRQLLSDHQSELARPVPSGALIFSCSARGKELFGQQGHDIGLMRKYLGDIPAAGFFSSGEIAPVGGKNFLHGVSISMALFYPE